MSIRASVLNRSILPRRRSLTRGCVTRRIFAASACLRPLDVISLWSWIIKSDRTFRCAASLGGKPRSRNTLPLDRVTLSFIVNLPSHGLVGPAFLKESAQAFSGQFQMALGSLPRALLECMQNVDALREFGDL